MKLRILLLSVLSSVLVLSTTPLFGQATPQCNQDSRITFNGEELPIINCLDDDVSPTFRLRSRPLTTNFAYLVADNNNSIIDISTDNFLDLESYGVGDFRVYSFSYLGNIVAEAGQDATMVELADQCYGLSSNFLEVKNIIPDGGTVATSEGNSLVYTCPGDGKADLITFQSTSSNPFYTYVVTDDQNRILQTLDGNEADFESAGPGTCRVWGLSFIGDLNLNPGGVLTEGPLASVCYDLSDNFVEVVRENPEGGNVSLTNGEEEATLCFAGTNTEILSFQTTGASSTPYVYLVTDENNVILEVLDGNATNFAEVGTGVRRVWGLAYTGELTVAAGQDASLVALSDDCYDLSDNFVTVVLRAISGGTVALEDGSTEALICVNDGVSDELTFTVTGQEEGNFTFIVTDDNNIILAVLNGNSNDFEEAGSGICRVWGLAYTGNLLAQEGDDAAAALLSDECFALSDNFVQVTRLEAAGGTISFDDGSSSKRICTGDEVADELDYEVSGNAGEQLTYLITDENNIILSITDDASTDFEGVAEGICRIWGLSYFGNLLAEEGQMADQIELADRCFALTENFIQVERVAVDGGTVALDNGEDSLSLCVGEGQDATFTMTNTTTTPNASYAYIITNENDDFLAVSESNEIDLSTAASGTCKVYGLSYTGNIDINDLDDVRFVALSDDCYDLSDNFVLVERTEVNGGTVAMPSGATERTVCLGDDDPDIVQFTSSGAIGASFVYVITDDNNTILGLTTEAQQDFGDVDAGVCRVWGLAYTGQILAEAGQNAAEVALSNGCFDLSDNFITVTRTEVDGGTVTLEDGTTETAICIDGLSNVLTVENTSAASANYIYLITDNNGLFLGSSANNTVDLTDASSGICRIYGLSYTGELAALNVQADNVTEITLSTECFALSNNFITVVREQVEGGSVNLGITGGTEVSLCAGDGVADFIGFDNNGSTGQFYIYVITDENNVILNFADGTEAVDFDSEAPGIYRVWGLAFTGNIIAMAGDVASEVNLTDDCFDLSDNFITVTANQVEGGTLSLPDGGTEATACVGDGNADIIEVLATGNSQGSYAYLVTTEDNELLQISDSNEIDFDAAAPGVCLIYGVAFTGDLTIEEGADITSTTLSNECFELSENAITVSKETVNGGTVATEDGLTEVKLCPGDNRPEVIRFDSTGVIGRAFAYLITDDQNIILAVLDSVDRQDFNTAPEGICRVWGLAYGGNLLAEEGQDAAAVALADDCFDLSDNFITVIREIPEGGTVRALNGMTALNICPGDGNPDVIQFANVNASGDNYAYLITDEDNIVLAVADGNSFDFEDAGVGVCRVWGLAYSGDLAVVPGDNAAISILSSDCWDLSDNFITVTREVPEGGSFTLANGTAFASVCLDDNPNFIEFVQEGVVGTSFAFVVLNISNLQVINDIVAIFDSTAFDFNTLPEGTYSIIGVAYEGSLNFGVGDNFNDFTQDLATGCAAISTSAATISVSTPMVGEIQAPSTELQLCTGDDNTEDDIVFFNKNTAPLAFSALLLTNENDELIRVINEDFINFAEYPNGNYRVRSISYTGILTADNGANILTAELATDCFAVSENFIAITNTMVSGGTISSPLIQSNDEIFICDDDQADVVSFENNSDAAAANYIYVLTDESDIILLELTGNEQDFNNTGFRVLKVWGLSYTGDLNLVSGETITDAQLATGCFDLSDNAITIFSDEPDGGTITTTAGEMDLTLCVGPDNAFLTMETDSNADLGYAYFLTDTSNVVVSATESDTVDFVNVVPGSYRIWGVSFSGTLNDITGQGADTAVISFSCFELSDNFVSVIRESEVDGGTLSTLTGDTLIYACPGGGGPDIVVINTTSQDTNYQLFITNGDGDIIVPDIGGNVIPFDGAAPGIYRIWGVGFNGTLELDFGMNIFEEELADSCWVLSSNSITVISELPEGGIVSTIDGAIEVEVVSGDGIPDTLRFAREDHSPNTLYTYVLTTANNNILGYTDSAQDFDLAAPGTYRVWGLAYTGELTGQIGGIATEVEITDDCWDLSDNFITVTVTELEGFQSNTTSSRAIEFNEFTLSLTPNPVADQLTVNLIAKRAPRKESIIQVFTAAGELVSTYQMPTVDGENKFYIDVTPLKAGIYVLHLTNGNKKQVARFARIN